MVVRSPQYLISACLCGLNCRYDGSSAAVDHFVRLVGSGVALPLCPELLGGLPVPRPACELLAGRVISRDGSDMTAAFARGALKTLELALEHRVRYVIFKERSPSCGSSMIYDGSFSGRLVPGRGVTTELLRRHGFEVLADDSPRIKGLIMPDALL